MTKPVAKLVALTGDLTDSQHGTNDTASGELLFGDATNALATNALNNSSRGGNDVLYSTGTVVQSYGDSFYMSDSSHGGNDSLFVANYASVNDIFGDVRYMGDYSQAARGRGPVCFMR